MDKTFILNFMDKSLQQEMKNFLNQNEDIQEIRLRVDKPVEIINNKNNFFLDVIASRKIIDSTLNIMTNYSLYSIEDELKNGFITLKGGYRIGIVGKVVTENGYVKTIKDISGLNIRFSREVNGAGDKILPYIVADNSVFHTLIVSPPQCGKTTIIRDISRQISNGIKNPKLDSLKVGVVDERSEIAGCHQGIPQNDVGLRTDVLDACPKASGIIMMIRSMSPDVIITDEIGTDEDIRAIEEALCAGIKIITTVHGRDLNDLKNKPVLNNVVEKRIFERIVILSNRYGVGTIEDVIDGKNFKSILYKRSEEIC